jgi:tetratricopeptide (TPR) repeat protein
LRQAFTDLLGEMVKCSFSTSKYVDEGIPHGEDWFQWIVEQVQECDFALILLTPASAQKPWILWEAGAVHGAAVASGEHGLRKVRPLVYQLDSEDLPSPIRDSKAQFRRGDSRDDVEALFTEILDQYRTEIQTERVKNAFKNLDKTITTYLDQVSYTLLRAPMLASSAAIEEWRQRLDEMLAHNRQSEVAYLHEWMNVAFGRSTDKRPRPLDFRIHMRLADLYLRSKNYKAGIEQLNLARQLAPRDIFVLRLLGRAHLDNKERDETKKIVDRIEELDKMAFIHNTECAALAGRLYRESDNLAKAGEIYAAALDANPDSYYLANLLGEIRVLTHDMNAATQVFNRTLGIIQRLRETNVWTLATAANANFVLGNDEEAGASLRQIHDRKPDAGSLSTIEDGLRRLSENLNDGAGRLSRLLVSLH